MLSPTLTKMAHSLPTHRRTGPWGGCAGTFHPNLQVEVGRESPVEARQEQRFHPEPLRTGEDVKRNGVTSVGLHRVRPSGKGPNLGIWGAGSPGQMCWETRRAPSASWSRVNMLQGSCRPLCLPTRFPDTHGHRQPPHRAPANSSNRGRPV